MKIAALACLFALAGCAAKTEKAVTEYKISEDGAPETRNESTYAALGDKTFNRVQKYRIVAEGENAKHFHLLMVSITKTVGKKKIDTVDAAVLPVTDGFAKYECAHYYDVKISQNIDDLSDPVCTFKPLGTLSPNGSAKFVTGG